MTTTVIKAIKPAGGGDYTSLSAWEAARAGDITATGRNTIEVAEVYSGGNASNGVSITYIGAFANWKTDPTHYLIIRAAAGHEHQGVWDTNKAYVSSNNANYTVECAYVYVQILNMQFQNIAAGTAFTLFGGYVATNPEGTTVSMDRCIFYCPDSSGSVKNLEIANSNGSGITATVTNSLLINKGSGRYGLQTGTAGSTVNLYNCTVVAGTSVYSYANGILTCNNDYLYTGDSLAYKNVGGTINKGSNDATSNTEATNSNLRNIPYSTATFLNVTPGSENLRLVVSAANKLLDHGANLTGSGVTTDIIGTARPQFSAFDIGAFENDIPVCWNYTARYKNSNKLFKTSGCGSFPKTLRVPSNVDTSTGRMVDDGIEIDPREYRII